MATVNIEKIEEELKRFQSIMSDDILINDAHLFIRVQFPSVKTEEELGVEIRKIYNSDLNIECIDWALDFGNGVAEAVVHIYPNPIYE